jgi:hypothetical protein
MRAEINVRFVSSIDDKTLLLAALAELPLGVTILEGTVTSLDEYS